MRSGRSGGGAGDRAAPAAWFHDRWIAFIGEAATFLTQGVTAAAGCQGGGALRNCRARAIRTPGGSLTTRAPFSPVCATATRKLSSRPSHMLCCGVQSRPFPRAAARYCRLAASVRHRRPPCVPINREDRRASPAVRVRRAGREERPPCAGRPSRWRRRRRGRRKAGRPPHAARRAHPRHGGVRRR